MGLAQILDSGRADNGEVQRPPGSHDKLPMQGETVEVPCLAGLEVCGLPLQLGPEPAQRFTALGVVGQGLLTPSQNTLVWLLHLEHRGPTS